MQVKRLTRQCMIVGTRYPIALVRGPGGTTMEVATMHAAYNPPDAAAVGRLDAQVKHQHHVVQLADESSRTSFHTQAAQPMLFCTSWQAITHMCTLH